jgi:GntR family transcriptional regulator, transcriptional repressor for pyruvate dehydrogenase complex
VSSAAQTSRLATSRVSRAEAVARDVEAEILGEGIPPGERLGTKEELRQRFGVAVATVNEAVRLLETRGLIEARPGPGGGVFVARSSVRVALKRDGLDGSWGTAGFADCLAVRNGLEPLVCREAARHHADEDIHALEKILAAMERHADEPRAYLELNWALHRRIAKLCRNAPLHSIYLTLIDFLEDGLSLGALQEFDGHADVEVHRQLVAAIDEGPGPRLEAAIERHERIPTLLVSARRTRRTDGSRPG